MTNLQFKIEENEFTNIVVLADNNEIANIELSDFNEGIVAHIEDVNIATEYRGKGLYKMMLLAIFNMTSFEVIRSDNRNDYSNLAYQKWCDNADLDFETPVEIRVYDETFDFEVCED